MKIHLAAAHIAVCLSMLLLVPLPSSAGPIDRVKAWERALNSHQTGKVLALYAEDATLDHAGMVVFKGKAEMRGFFEWDRVMNIRLSLSNFRQEGDTVFCTGIETSDWLTAAGLGEQSYSAIKFTFREGMVTFQQEVLSPESFKALIETSHALQIWASQERSEQVATMRAGGKFIYNEETAKMNLDLMREWREATKTR